MYIHVYVCMYVCMYACMCVYIYIYIHITIIIIIIISIISISTSFVSRDDADARGLRHRGTRLATSARNGSDSGAKRRQLESRGYIYIYIYM